MLLLLHRQAFGSKEGFSTLELLMDVNYNHKSNTAVVMMMMQIIEKFKRALDGGCDDGDDDDEDRWRC